MHQTLRKPRFARISKSLLLAFVRASVIVQFECGAERFVQSEDLLPRKRTDEVRQHGFRDAHEFIAMYAAFVLHPFIRTY